MARQKSEFLSAFGTAFEIFKAIVNKVLDLGGSDEDMRRILKDEALRGKIAELIISVGSAVKDTFKVVVDYGKTLAEMIEAGHYDMVNRDITQEHFPAKGEGTQEVTLRLIYFNRVMNSEQVLAKIEKQGYRPAILSELLALGAAHSELYKEFSIIALGSVWQDSYNKSVVPSINSERHLVLRLFESDWNESFCFVAVRSE